uniref:Transmembrane domain protein n=1 Tax=Thermococcus prieurii TaxID=1128108 RepID=R4L7E9_9EURY|nr:transmembrane domain protein [Thermococcus prieurii]
MSPCAVSVLSALLLLCLVCSLFCLLVLCVALLLHVLPL